MNELTDQPFTTAEKYQESKDDSMVSTAGLDFKGFLTCMGITGIAASFISGAYGIACYFTAGVGCLACLAAVVGYDIGAVGGCAVANWN
ncbi:hypothetical protein MUO14_21095 [Halobacillus shinanisalinarum]|uniref:Uncharacterized protein n=1 Tax=Halobacillus shinanisalinarum TaxID=2932258 RepID=A0ABY4H1M4_9BACI|nr:hypothetical protein [Halobacillus shinanisalinarum]UOQ92872.1 hypothetical protein MUO14_21095 [Halobacillus shinanisalinarum]